MKKLTTLWRRHPVLTSAFLLAAALTVFFITRSIMFTLYWSDPARRDQAIEAWMTPGYVAHSWQLPREALARALDLSASDGRPRTLGQIATDKGQSLAELTALVEAVAKAHREATR